MMQTPLTNTLNLFFYQFICVAATTPIICGDYEYEDPYTNACYTVGTSCPVVTTTPISLTAKNWCPKCIQPQCLDCVVTARSTCLDCDQTLLVQLRNGFCDCITSYGKSYANTCVLCSMLHLNCQDCVNQWNGCTRCVANYWPDTSGDCVDCPTFQPNCVACATNGSCTQCIANYWPSSSGSCVVCSSLHPNCQVCDPTDGRCTQCNIGFGTTSSGDCVACYTPYSNCGQCVSDTTGCTACLAVFWFDSNNECVNCQTLHPMCISCASLDGACLSCTSGFGVTATNDCDSCSVFYTNCLTCDTYNTGCTQCALSYGINLLGQCDSCSTLYPNCIQCLSYSTGCNLCDVGYGIDSSGLCAICSSLHPNCDQCFSQTSGCTKCKQGSVFDSSSPFFLFPRCIPCTTRYTINCVQCIPTTCTKCMETSGIALSGSCDACSALYSDCRLCLSHNSGCSECNDGYGLNAAGQCATCISFYSNCSKCTKQNAGCTECATYFGITATKHCENCGIFYFSCLLCSSYDTGCTECVTGFGVNSLGGCTACSTLFSNCQICTSYDTGCTSCISGYGKDSSDLCQLCSTFYSDCALCSSYDTGCTQCIAGANIHLINSLCKRCTQIDPECVTCQPNSANSDIVCNSCAVGYYLDSSQNICIKCSTVIDDCDQCIYNSTLARVQCTLCSQQYLVDQRFWCQTCKVHVYYERMCYYLPGCSSLAVINGTLICLACTMPNFEFSIKLKKCVCQKGFTFNTSDDKCMGKCGDGIKVASEDCDDGNLNFGDGCSEMCKIQTNFKCTQDNGSLSTCILHQNVLLSLDYMLKLQGENKAELHFNFEPAPSLLSMIDWQKTISLEFPAIDRKPVVSYSYENGVLKVLLGYFDNIEGKTCQISVKFDSSTIVSNPQPLLFQISGKNEKLNYESSSSNSSQKSVGIISSVLGIAALCCFIVSSYFHKLIGLETLQFIQLIYFSRILFSGSSQSNVMAFNSLKYSNGYNQINLSGAKPDSNISEMPPIFLKIQLQMYYLDNCNMMIIPILLATLAYSFYFLRRSRAQSHYQETKQIAIRDNILDMSRKITWIFQNFIFSYTLALLYLTVFQLFLYELSDLSNSTQTNPLYVSMSFSVSLVILVYIFSIFCSQTIQGFKNYFNSRQNKQNHFDQNKALNDQGDKDYHPLYVPFYLLYQFSLIILINTVLLEFTYLAQVMAGLILAYTLVFLCWRPYSLSIHNYANIYHQLVLIMFFSMEILGKLDLLSDTLKVVSLYTTIALISVALAIQILRVYRFQNSLQRKFIVEKVQKKQKPAELKLIKPNNPYIMNYKPLMNKIGQAKGEYQIDDIVDQSIYGREMLRKRLRQQKRIQDQKLSKLESNLIEDDTNLLKKLKDKMRIKAKAHQQWIFR